MSNSCDYSVAENSAIKTLSPFSTAPAALRNLIVADSLLAAVLIAVALVRVIGQPGSAHSAAIGLAVIGPLCLIWRRTAPVVVLAAGAGSFCAYQLAGFPHTAVPFSVLIALYTVACHRGAVVAAVSAAAVAVCAIGSGVLGSGWSAESFDDQVIAYLLSVGAACSVGYAVQLSRTRAALLHEQAVRLEAQHAVHEQLALRHEQARIARELHDVVAHQVSLITALAAGADRIFDTEPNRARRALGSIEQAGREALVEMRRLLRLPRADTGRPEPASSPSLSQLPALVERTERAGLPVRLSVRGKPRSLPAVVEMCAFRIVQEALTNVLKHAGPAEVAVLVDYQPALLELRISDDGRGLPSSPVAGQGLIGMRERARLVGGRLVVSQRPGGGVEVAAALPVPGEPT